MEGIKCCIPDENTKNPPNYQRTVKKSYKCAFGKNSQI